MDRSEGRVLSIDKSAQGARAVAQVLWVLDMVKPSTRIRRMLLHLLIKITKGLLGRDPVVVVGVGRGSRDHRAVDITRFAAICKKREQGVPGG